MPFIRRFGVTCSATAIMPGRIFADLLRMLCRPQTIIGCVDGPSRGRLHGWAFDRRNPLQRLTVVMQHPDGRRLVTLADRYRADVQKAGIGDGHYGFSLPSPGMAGPVYVMQPRSAIALPLNPSRPPTGRRPQTHHAGSYRLHVDLLSPGQISGWAVDRARPELRRNLQLYCNGRFAGHRRATLYRPEIVDTQCDGYHGFWFALPAGELTSITIKDVGLDRSFVARLSFDP